jgi:hypothetical protein
LLPAYSKIVFGLGVINPPSGFPSFFEPNRTIEFDE